MRYNSNTAGKSTPSGPGRVVGVAVCRTLGGRQSTIGVAARATANDRDPSHPSSAAADIAWMLRRLHNNNNNNNADNKASHFVEPLHPGSPNFLRIPSEPRLKGCR
ncbi:unnamed protein product [Merluccius merluccius]